MELILSNYGAVIATDLKSEEIYNKIKSALKNNEEIIIDAKDVTISTKSARLIFGRLYRELKDLFIAKIKFKNNSSLFTFSVNEGISTELENIKK
jgi:hypothetical protein